MEADAMVKFCSSGCWNETFFHVFYDSGLWMNPLVLKACKDHNIPLHDNKYHSLTDIVNNNNIDRVYTCLPTNRLTNLNCEVYGTIHGLRELEVPIDDFFYKYKTAYKERIKFTMRRLFPSQFLKARHRSLVTNYARNNFHPITVSEHTYYSLLTYLPEFRDIYIPIYYSPNTSSNNIPQNVSNRKEKYMLLVSGNRWEKNNLRAIMAFDRLLTNNMLGDCIRMKVVGAKRINFKCKLRNPDKFDFLGYVDDAVLNDLYANAYLFVYPSLNEGFGYPPLEAMRYKVPVISSPFAAMSEICDGGVLFFNPLSIEEIMNRMIMMMNYNIHSESLVSR